MQVRAQVAELRSLYIDQRVTEIREANERRDPGTDRNDRFVRMFAFALGDPFPGDPMPPYAGEPVGLARLVQLGQLARFSAERLYLELYELRSLIQLKQRRADADADWTEINRLLERAGQRRTQNPAWKLAPADPRRFADNLAKALGTGIRNGVFWRDMGVTNLPSGQPTMALTGGAAQRLAAMTPPGHRARIHLTITDDFPMAQAFIIIEALPENG